MTTATIVKQVHWQCWLCEDAGTYEAEGLVVPGQCRCGATRKITEILLPVGLYDLDADD